MGPTDRQTSSGIELPRAAKNQWKAENCLTSISRHTNFYKVEKFSEKSAGGNVRRKGSFDEIEEFEKFSKTILAKFQPK